MGECGGEERDAVRLPKNRGKGVLPAAKHFPAGIRPCWCRFMQGGWQRDVWGAADGKDEKAGGMGIFREYG